MRSSTAALELSRPGSGDLLIFSVRISATRRGNAWEPGRLPSEHPRPAFGLFLFWAASNVVYSTEYTWRAPWFHGPRAAAPLALPQGRAWVEHDLESFVNVGVTFGVSERRKIYKFCRYTKLQLLHLFLLPPREHITYLRCNSWCNALQLDSKKRRLFFSTKSIKHINSFRFHSEHDVARFQSIT
jgi:hypothetical protein